MNNEIIKAPTGHVVDYKDQQTLQVIRNTICQGATEAEFLFFINVCKSTGLNPFKRDVWFIKTKSYKAKNGQDVEGKIQIMTGINGFYEVANRNPNFDGIKRSYGPLIEVKAGQTTIKVPEYIDSEVYRRDRSFPQSERAYWSEFAGDLVTFTGKLTIWAQKPHVMLTKCADALALRKSFPQELGGLYAEEELEKGKEDRLIDAAFDEDERRMREEGAIRLKAKLEAGEIYQIEHGSSLRGQKVCDIENGIALAKHLEKYRAQIPELAIKQIDARLRQLRKEFKEMKERERLSKMADVAPEAQGFDAAEIPTFEEMQAKTKEAKA